MKLKNVLTEKEFKVIKDSYKKRLNKPFKGYNSGILKKFLENSYNNLEDFEMDDVSFVLNEVKLPFKLKKKLEGIYENKKDYSVSRKWENFLDEMEEKGNKFLKSHVCSCKKKINDDSEIEWGYDIKHPFEFNIKIKCKNCKKTSKHKLSLR